MIISAIFAPLASIILFSFLSNTLFIGNLALAVSGIDTSRKGYAAIYKACVLVLPIKGTRYSNGSTAASSAHKFLLTCHWSLVSLRLHNYLGRFDAQVVLEVMLIAWFHILLLLPVVNQALWRIKVIKEMMLWWFKKIKGVLEYDDLELMTPLSPGLYDDSRPNHVAIR